METVSVIFKRKTAPSDRRPLPSGSPYDTRYGFWGMVTELHPENNTVRVRTDAGIIISNVRVASPAWVTIDEDKKHLTGRRSLPPVDSYVYCAMPNGEYSSAFVLCSGFSGDPRHAEFKEDSEDAKFIDKQILNSGWTYSEDKRTGTKTIANKPEDETMRIEVNQEEEGKNKTTVEIYGVVFEIDEENKKTTADIYGNIFTVDEENGVTVETEKDLDFAIKGNVNVSIEGDMAASVKGKADITADGDIAVRSKNMGILTIGNAAATIGSMISDLLQALISFKSIGSPASHTAPELTAAAVQIKAKWDQVFKK
jgi:hypothetical protein